MPQIKLTPAQKFARWQRIYKKIKTEIHEQGLIELEAYVYYLRRVREEKLKMMGK